MMNNVTYKEWLGLPAAFIFWVVSIFCFVLGLAFKSQTGFVIPVIGDVAVLFSFGLGIANTIVQIIGNDHTKEELGMVLFLGWMGSYMLGIGSNVNYLYDLIAIQHPFLQFLVCFGLGTMVEVIPERLVVRFLRKARIISNFNAPQNRQTQNKPDVKQSQPIQQLQRSQQQRQNNGIPQIYEDKALPKIRPQPKPIPAEMPVYDVSKNSQRQQYPTYHPVDIQGVDLPEFMRGKRDE